MGLDVVPYFHVMLGPFTALCAAESHTLKKQYIKQGRVHVGNTILVQSEI